MPLRVAFFFGRKALFCFYHPEKAIFDNYLLTSDRKAGHNHINDNNYHYLQLAPLQRGVRIRKWEN